jgi:hypothetical protein
VTNTGGIAGDEVVQLYIHQRAGLSSRPIRELKGFERAGLQPGESKTVRFTLGKKETYTLGRKPQRLGGKAGAVRCLGRWRFECPTACKFPRGGVETPWAVLTHN